MVEMVTRLPAVKTARERILSPGIPTVYCTHSLSLFMNSCFSNSTLNIDDSYDACMLHTVYHHACMDAMLKYITYASIFYLFIYLYIMVLV
jgi:hypothetical protein